MIVLSLGGWLTASGVGLLAGGAWRALTGRMETVARACHELRGPLTAARLSLAELISLDLKARPRGRHKRRDAADG